jgi:hypothetical protein
LPNPRIRGKISKEEWVKIAARFHSGETFAQIARSYQCTPPAIRYIVARVPTREVRKMIDRDTQGKVALLAPPATGRRSRNVRTEEHRERTAPRANFQPDAPVKDVWARINIDIATFLAAMQSVSEDDSDDNYQALLEATDRLLWGSARTRLELERILSSGKRSAIRRIAG